MKHKLWYFFNVLISFSKGGFFMNFDHALLGEKYFSLDAAQVDKSPDELVIADPEESGFYIISRESYEEGPQLAGYKILISEGE
jgi:hypothetical protein